MVSGHIAGSFNSILILSYFFNDYFVNSDNSPQDLLVARSAISYRLWHFF
jgi:hypothetical protein